MRLALGIVFLALPSSLHGQGVTYDGCVDMRGIPVASVLDYNLNDVATAALAPNGAPIILYNPRVLASTRWQTRLFFYAHECGHHALGHPLEGLRPGQEQEADCWGIRTLVEAGRLSDTDISLIQQDISNFARGDWTHLPGPQRAINLRLCLGNSSSAESDDSRPESATSRGSLSESLQAIIEASGNGFRTLRGVASSNGNGEAWNSKVILPGARECTVWIYHDRSLGRSVFCEMGQGSDHGAMLSKYRQVTDDIQGALPDGWSATRTVEGKRTVFQKGSSGATVEVILREHSGIYRVMVEISLED